MKTMLVTLTALLMTVPAIAMNPADLTRDWCNYSIEDGQAKVFYKIQLQPKSVLKIVRDGKTVVTGTWRISGPTELTFAYKKTAGAEYPHGKLEAELTIDSELTALSLMQGDNAVALNACAAGE